MRNMAAALGTSLNRRKHNGTSKDDSFDDRREVFDSSLITAMRMADSYLTSGEYMKIADSWRPEWDVAVQIPRSARKRALKIAEIDPCRKQKEDFRLEDHFSSTGKCLRCSGKKLKMANGGVEKPRKASELYDIDLIDSAWLTSMNETRRAKGDDEIDSALFEIVMEYLELLAQRNVVQLRKKRKKRGGALTNGSSDLDQNVCDVCRAETEDLNYARCASCSTLVHCACYGVSDQEAAQISDSSWICKPCTEQLSPTCALCLRAGGALKPTEDGALWCHVACVLWTPECSLADPVLLEPVIQLDLIPNERWSATCSLCERRGGACLFCSADACRTAFHVRCAFAHSLTMTTQFEDDADADVRLLAYCAAHSKPKDDECADKQESDKEKQERPVESLSDEDLQRVAQQLDTSVEKVHRIAAFWKLKRFGMFNQALLPESVLNLRANEPLFDCERPKEPPNTQAPPPSKPDSVAIPLVNEQSSVAEEPLEVEKPREPRTLVEQVRELIGLRKNLDQLRNVVYLIQRRERTRRQLLATSVLIREAQISAVTKHSPSQDLKTEPDGDNADLRGETPVVNGASSPTTEEPSESACKRPRRETFVQRANVGSSIYDNVESFIAALERYRNFCGAADDNHRNSMVTEADHALLTDDASDFLIRYILDRPVRARVKVHAVLSKLSGEVTLSNADRIPSVKRIADRLIKLAKTGRPKPDAAQPTNHNNTKEQKSKVPGSPDAETKRRKLTKKQRMAYDSRLDRALVYSIPECVFQIDSTARERLQCMFTNKQLVRSLLTERARFVLDRLVCGRELKSPLQPVGEASQLQLADGAAIDNECQSETQKAPVDDARPANETEWPVMNQSAELSCDAANTMRRSNGLTEACDVEPTENGFLLPNACDDEHAAFPETQTNSPLDVLTFLNTLESELG